MGWPTPLPLGRYNCVVLLAIEINNSTIALGIHDGQGWRARWRMQTVVGRTEDEYAFLLGRMLEDLRLGVEPRRAVLASVVPALTAVFCDVVQRVCRSRPLVLGPGVKTGLDLRVDHPSEVGADLVAGAVAAHALAQGACVVVGFGAATTFTAVSAQGALVGVAIAPGLRTGAEALAERTAGLPRVPLLPPPSVLGKNTLHAMQAGIVTGHVGMVRHLVGRIGEELGTGTVGVATGELAPLLAPLVPEIAISEPWLTLDGLRLIADRNL